LAVGENRTGGKQERAVLVGVDLTRTEPGVRSRSNRAGVAGARLGLVCLDSADMDLESENSPSNDGAVPESPKSEGFPPSSAYPSVGQGLAQVHARADTSLDLEESLAEFRDLVSSAGALVVAEVIQRRSRPDPATLIGAGKVEEIAGVAASTEADLVLFDHDLTPTQLRNLEAALPCRVLDRTQLILDIFARHARTSEGKLQVELAQLEYMLPRLTGKGKAMSQLGGGIGTRGPGETKLETDRLRIQSRIDHLKG